MITLDHLNLARQRIAGVVVRTPLIRFVNSAPDRTLYFKPENLQPIGAFKLRGA